MTQVSRIPLGKDIQNRIFSIFLTSFQKARSSSEIKEFIDDLLSPTEQIMLAKRISIAFLLSKGYNQRTISQILKVSSTTVNKISLRFKYGGNGYHQVIREIINQEKIGEFIQKIDDFISDLVPPKGRDWSQWRKDRFTDKLSRQKPY